MIVGVVTAGTPDISEERSQKMDVALSINASVAESGLGLAGQVSRGTTI